jgi:hypothetical protein
MAERIKADDDGVLLPPAQFEMMMERRHRKDALAGEAKLRTWRIT